MCQALHFGDTTRDQWARNDYQTHARHTQRCRTGMGGQGKGAGNDTDRGYASGFSQNGVVETPRCAGASIRDAVNDGITLRYQRGDRLLDARSAIAKLGGIDHALDPVFLFEDFVQLLQEGIRVVLAVFQESDDFADDTGQHSTGVPNLGRLFRAGIQDVNRLGVGNHTPCSSLYTTVIFSQRTWGQASGTTSL